MSEILLAFVCRNAICSLPAKKGTSCCSQHCRDGVPNCNVENCMNAVEGGISNGAGCYGVKCYNHGGRFHFDGDPQDDIKPEKLTFVNTVEGWKIAINSKGEVI